MADYANSSGTKCPKCENTSFEFVDDFPTKGAFRMYYIRCSSCKVFLQAIPFQNTNTMIENMQADINKLKNKIGIYS